MNKKTVFNNYIPLTFVLVTILGSCATAPAVEEPYVQEVVTEEVVEESSEVVEQNDTLVLEAFDQAVAAKEDAIKNKAHKAVAEEYNVADLTFKDAKSLHEEMKYDQAIISYNSATDKFISSTKKTKIKRQRALEAITEASETISQIELNAESALAEVQEEKL